MRAAVPVVLGYLGVGIAAGVVERAAGLSYAEVLLISTVLYAGSAQFVVTSMLSLASPASAIVLTVFFLNLRHLLLSAALATALRGVPAWKNALLGLQLTDETFVVASGRRPLSAAWMAGLNLAAWSAWAVANLAGAALSAAAARGAGGGAFLRRRGRRHPDRGAGPRGGHRRDRAGGDTGTRARTMEVRPEILALVLGCALVTAVPRVLPLVALSQLQLPPWLADWLRYVPIAVLAALLAIELASAGAARGAAVMGGVARAGAAR